MKIRTKTLALAIIATSGVTAHAQALSESWSPGPQWEVVVGAGVSFDADYEGSDEMEANGVPFLLIRRGRFALNPAGIDFSAWEGERASLAVSLGYGGGRDPDDVDSGALDGFEEIDDTAVLGAVFDYNFGPAELFMGVEHYLGESDGTSMEVGVRCETDVTDRLSISMSTSATFSDGKYMEKYFGVTARDAAATGYSEYKAGSGLRRVDISVGATYAMRENWLLMGEVGVGKLMGDAEDSPIVRDDVQPRALLSVGYVF